MDPNTQRNIVLRFDMRASPECPDSPTKRYRAAIEMASWADRNAVDVVGLSEHHNTEDGFLSAPLQLAGMMVAATSHVRISVIALLVPLHKLGEGVLTSREDLLDDLRVCLYTRYGHRTLPGVLYGVVGSEARRAVIWTQVREKERLRRLDREWVSC